jgi:hypothetical protein
VLYRRDICCRNSHPLTCRACMSFTPDISKNLARTRASDTFQTIFPVEPQKCRKKAYNLLDIAFKGGSRQCQRQLTCTSEPRATTSLGNSLSRKCVRSIHIPCSCGSNSTTARMTAGQSDMSWPRYQPSPHPSATPRIPREPSSSLSDPCGCDSLATLYSHPFAAAQSA